MHLSQILILAGLFVGFVGFIWGVILAFRASIWWGLAFLFLPLGWVIFMLGHLHETKRATVVILLGIGLVVTGVVQSPSTARAATAAKKTEQPKKEYSLEKQWEARVAARKAEVDKYQAQADRQCAELNQKRATTNPQDKTAVAAFNTEVIQYNALLDQIKTMRAQLQNP